MIYRRYHLHIIILITLLVQVACSHSNMIDDAIKKHGAARYYYEQMDYIRAEKYCKEALDLWRTIENSKMKLVPNWSIENNINSCKMLLEMIPTSETLKAPAVVPIKIINNTILVDADLNQKENVTLMLDTGANRTILTPEIASLLGISPKKDDPTYPITVIGGDTIQVPFVSLSEIKVGEAVVKKLMVGVYSVFPDMPGVDGILGADFLAYFTVTIDHHTGRLTLISRKGSI